MCGSFNTAKVYNKMTEVPDLGLRQKKPLWIFKFFISHFFITLMKVIVVCAMAGIQGFLINQCFIIVIVYLTEIEKKRLTPLPPLQKLKILESQPTHPLLVIFQLLKECVKMSRIYLVTTSCYGILQGVIFEISYFWVGNHSFLSYCTCITMYEILQITYFTRVLNFVSLLFCI